MIRVNKPNAPDVLTRRGAVAQRRLCDDHDLDPGPLTRGEVEFDRGIYAHDTVKEALRTAQFSKCAFCESKVAHVSHGDIEHYRPKKASAQRDGESLIYPGYYWLVYEWDNLFYCCQLCNQSFKRNLFPLRDPRRRARSHHDNITDEKPLLVHPARDNPEQFVTYRGEEARAVRNRREGTATVAVVGLNRDDLVEMRREHLRLVRLLIRHRDHWRRTQRRRALTADEAALLTASEQELLSLQGDQAPYAAMTRALLC